MIAEPEDKTAGPVRTTWRVEAVLRRLDRTIAQAEERLRRGAPGELRSLTQLKRQRTELNLLLVARRIEVKKQLVSLQRWRDGFGAGCDILRDTGS